MGLSESSLWACGTEKPARHLKTVSWIARDLSARESNSSNIWLMQLSADYYLCQLWWKRGRFTECLGESVEPCFSKSEGWAWRSAILRKS
ncbi:hypothetical protein TKK_0017021 [Trichogramma kaykai]